jgi:hypothetical protein
MTERGYIALARGWFEHDFFVKEPLTEREAFIWLIFEAAWKPTRVRRNDSMVSLGRGELAHALEFMRAAWRWQSKSRVVRFLARLEAEQMIERKPLRDATHITICNYEKYQNSQNAKRNATKTPTRRDRDELEEVNQGTNKPKEVSSAPNGAHSPAAELSKVLDATRTQAVIEHRKKKRAPLTAHAAALLAKKFGSCPDPNAAADAMIANGWQGFESSWLTNRSANRANGPPGKRTLFDAAVDWIAEGDSAGQDQNSDHDDVKLISATARKP